MVLTSVFTGLAQDATLANGVRGVVGNLVKAPFPAYSTVLNNAATISPTPGGNGGGNNPDGTTQQVTPLVPVPGTWPCNSIMRFEFYGRVFGVRFDRRVSATTMPFDVVIDGVCYPVDDVHPRWNNQAGTATDFEGLILVATGLADKLHTCEIHVNVDPALTNTNGPILYGMIVERSRGYSEFAPLLRAGYTAAATTLGTGFTLMEASTTPTNASALTFHNTDSVSHTVTVCGPSTGGGLSTNVYRTFVLTAAGTAGADTTLAFTSPRNLTGWTWKTDLAAVVIAWIEQA